MSLNLESLLYHPRMNKFVANFAPSKIRRRWWRLFYNEIWEQVLILDIEFSLRIKNLEIDNCLKKGDLQIVQWIADNPADGIVNRSSCYKQKHHKNYEW